MEKRNRHIEQHVAAKHDTAPHHTARLQNDPARAEGAEEKQRGARNVREEQDAKEPRENGLL